MIRFGQYAVVSGRRSFSRKALWSEFVNLEKILNAEVKLGDLVLLLSSESKWFVFFVDFLISRGIAVSIVSPEVGAEKLLALIERYKPNVLLADPDIVTDSLSDLPIVARPGVRGIYKPAKIKEMEPVSRDLALLLFTSGSTGSPQACKISKLNLCSSLDQIVHSLDLCGNDSTITTLHFDYIYGLSVLLSHMYVGGSVMLNTDSIMSDGFLHKTQLLENFNLNLVPAQFELLQRLGFDRIFKSSIKFITQAGGKLPTWLAEEIQAQCERRRIGFYIMYGQTEASPRICVNPVHLKLFSIASVGVPVKNGNIRLKDKDRCGAGEIMFSGPNVFCGYALTREDLSACKPEPELATGDLGCIDRSGGLLITGRKKRIGKISGRRINLEFLDEKLSELCNINFYSFEVEGKLVIFHHPITINFSLARQLLREQKINPALVEFRKLIKTPLTESGKIDLGALQTIAQTNELA